MRTTLILTLLIVFSMCSIGCNESGGSAERSAPGAQPITGGPGDGTQDPGLPSTTSVTYYALSRTEAPVNGWPTKTYSATGYCAEIQGVTYCWSDGLKTLTWTFNNFTYGPLYYNYFGVSTSNNNPQTCHGGCADDYMDSPVTVTNQLLQVIPAQDIQDIFDHGTPGTLNCTSTQAGLNCGSVIFAEVL